MSSTEDEVGLDTGDGPEQVATETLLRRVLDIISNARPMPLSTTVRVERDEVLELLEEAVQRLPEELREARWMLKERQEYLAKVERDGDEILESARVRAERMVQRTEIVRSARHTASRMMEDARESARRLRLEAEDFCDQKLAAFEIVLERTMKTVQAGREKLKVTPATPGEESSVGLSAAVGDLGASPGADEFFDQDQG
ncbi:MAG: ATPase [Actinomycetota bacterium]|nr:ATPase [Actinomycetota bacterium]